MSLSDDVERLKTRIIELSTENDALKLENSTQKKITHEQAKALTQISNDNEYPTRMKGLIDELRVQKDSYSKLKDKFNILERNSHKQ